MAISKKLQKKIEVVQTALEVGVVDIHEAPGLSCETAACKAHVESIARILAGQQPESVIDEVKGLDIVLGTRVGAILFEALAFYLKMKAFSANTAHATLKALRTTIYNAAGVVRFLSGQNIKVESIKVGGHYTSNTRIDGSLAHNVSSTGVLRAEIVSALNGLLLMFRNCSFDNITGANASASGGIKATTFKELDTYIDGVAGGLNISLPSAFNVSKTYYDNIKNGILEIAESESLNTRSNVADKFLNKALAIPNCVEEGCATFADSLVRFAFKSIDFFANTSIKYYVQCLYSLLDQNTTLTTRSQAEVINLLDRTTNVIFNGDNAISVYAGYSVSVAESGSPLSSKLETISCVYDDSSPKNATDGNYFTDCVNTISAVSLMGGDNNQFTLEICKI